MNKISVKRIADVAWPVTTPIGISEKRFIAMISNFNKTGATLSMEIEIRGDSEKNGNRIVVNKLAVAQLDETSYGVTGEILRGIAVQKLAEECVREAIRSFYPETVKKGKHSLKVPSVDEVSRMQLVALTSQSLGIKPPAAEIQAALKNQGVFMEIGTIRNYLTKAKKAGLLGLPATKPDSEISLKSMNPDQMSNESNLINDLLAGATKTGNPVISPQEHRRRRAAVEADAKAKIEREARIIKIKREADISKYKTPVSRSSATKRKEGK